MSDTALYESRNNYLNGTNNTRTDNEIAIDMEVTTNDKVQEKYSAYEDTNKEKKQIKDNDVSLTIAEDILKPYIYVQDDTPIYRRNYWIQYVGPRVEPLGDSLDYSPESRNGFVRLVFLIVFIMLLFTAGFILVVIYVPVLNDFFRRYSLFMIIPASIIILAMSYAFSCSSCTRVPPCNFICLIIVMVCMSVIAACVTRRYSTQSILYAVLATALVVLVCMCLACSSFDFTKFLLYAIIIGVALGAIALVVMLGMLITGHYIQTVHLIILIVLTLVQCVFLTIELQMILGGRAVELGEDDYALAAYMLYTSLVQIFISMVSMIGMFE